MKYVSGIEVSKRMCLTVVNYYKDLFESYEIKSIPEIADTLSINEVTVRRILESIYNGKRADGSFSNTDLMILLCTKFGSGSPYLKDQQDENIQRLIKRRKIMYTLKNALKSGVLQEQPNEEVETNYKHR